MKAILLCVLVLILSFQLCIASSPKELFAQFKKLHNKQYVSPREEELRFQTYLKNFELVSQLNQQQTDAFYGLHGPYMDMSPQEFKNTILMRMSKKSIEKALQEVREKETNYFSTHTVKDLPDNFDWRQSASPAMVTPVKDQASCGSCWAFSAVQAMEGANAKLTSQMVALSPEQLVECDKLDCGCFGGFPSRAYDYLIKNGGLATEHDYPYCIPPLGNCYPCNTNSSYCPKADYCNTTCAIGTKVQPSVSISGYESAPTNEDQIAQYLMDHGPLSVCLNYNLYSAMWLQFYHHGISNPEFCSPSDIDHCVLLVGFGTETTILGSKKHYWLVKNSWGVKWGEQGYFKLARGTGKCGINTMVTWPTIVKKH